MGYKIIHAEDDIAIRENLKEFFEIFYDYVLISYEDGGGVVNFINQANTGQMKEDELPDLFLLDIMMPKYDGWELARLIRESPILEKIPIVMLSAIAEKKDIAVSLNIANDHITKPFSMEGLLQRISEIIAEHQWRNTAD